MTSNEPRTPEEHDATAAGAATPPAERTLVEDVLLLLFQPDSGTIAGENILFYVLGGAVVTDLALAQKVETRPASLFGNAVHAIGEAPSDELLEPAWSYVAEKPRGVQTVLAAIGPRLREPVLDRLVARGDLLRENGRALGIFPTTKLALGSDRRRDLLEPVRAALVDGADPEPRAAAAIALLSASGTLPQFDREIPWGSDVYTRGKQFEQGDWGAAAAASAVARTMTAIVMNAVVAATATASQRP